MYQERPEIRWDQAFCVGTAGIATGAIGWLAWRIAGDLERNHAVEFIVIGLLAGLLAYSAWLILALVTVRYVLKGDRLLLRQGWRKAEIPLNHATHLYRWRRRWSWEGGLQRDLNVRAVQFFPPFWLWREQELWVLHAGDRAVAFRPSQRLLSEIKALVRPLAG